jgi:preprotein translocase subunit SecF
MPIADLINIAINSTLSRSVITHVTVTLALLALLFFGGPTIHSFSAAMTFGAVLVGSYTSIFIASPLLIYLGVGESRLAAEDAGKTDAPGLPAKPAPAKR